MKEEKKLMVRTKIALAAPSNFRVKLPAGSDGTKESMMDFLGQSQKNYDFAIKNEWIQEYAER